MTQVGLNKIFSASTALILMDGIEIGELQNLNVREEFNVRPVVQLGSSIPVAFVPGVYNGTASARRALLDIDKIFQVLAPGTDAKSLQDLLDATVPGVGSIIQTAQTINDVIYQIANFFSAKTKGEPWSQIVNFSIKILDMDNKEQMRLENCVLTGRSFTMDVSALVVIQDLNIIFQKRVV
jgi:hypothetical protein